MEQDLVALLESMPPEELQELLSMAFSPYQQEQDVLDKQMALGGQMRQRGGGGSTPMGALLGGLSGALGGTFGAHQQADALRGQRALGERMRDNSVETMLAGLKMPNSASVGEILRKRGNRGTSPADLAFLMGDK